MIKTFLKLFALLFILKVFLQPELCAQPLAPDFTWANNYGGTGSDGSFDIVADHAGNIIAAGSFENTISFGSFQLTATSQTLDIFVAKFNSDGEVIWAKSAGGGDYDRAYGVTVDEFDNIIVTGTFNGRAFFDTSSILSNGNADIFIAKYSPGGSLQWVINYGTEGGYEYAFDIATDDLNNILVTGTSQTFGAVALPILILTLKFNAQGLQQWESAAGGLNFNNSGYGIAVNSNNDVFITGCAADSVTFSATSYTIADPGGDIFIAKYDANGVFNWVEQAGFNNNNDQGGAITINENDDLFVTGHFREAATFGGNITLTPTDNADIFVAKYNQFGDLLWVKQDSLIDASYGTGISLDAAGNISVIGSYFLSQQENNSILIERYNNDGEQLWYKIIGTSPSSGYPGGIDNDENGDIVFSGYYFSLQSQTQDIIVGKLPAPNLIPGLNPIDFGIVEVGGSSPNILSLSNTTLANLFLFSIILEGPDAGDFSILSSYPQTIPPQDLLNVDLQFSPLSEGTKNAYLIIESDAPTSPDTVFLTGIGGVPSLSLSTDSLNFGSVLISDSLDLDLLVSNLSTIDIFFFSFQLNGSEFTFITQLPDTIHSDEAIPVTIRFTPGTPGLINGSLIITSSSANSPDTIFLYGTGAIPSLALSSDSLNFGTVDVNNFSDLTLTITNENSFDIIIEDVFFQGIGPGDFSLVSSPQFPFTIPGGGFINFNVRFAPSSSGIKASNLIIVSNSSSSPDAVSLTGNGVESIIVDLPDTTIIGQSTTINVNSPGTGFTTNQFFYRRTGESNYQESALTPSGINFTANIPQEFSTIRGIQFYILFSGTPGSISYPTNNPDTNPASLQVQIPVLDFPGNISQNNYQMISIPLSLSDPQLNSVLEDDYGPYNNKLWRLFKWDPSANNYAEYENILDNFQPGNSFWLINRDGNVFNIENSTSVSSNNSYTITLLPGYNQIANPFAFPVDWSTIGNSNLILQAPIGWSLEEQDYLLNQVVLNPWEGYWVFNQSDAIINLNVPPVESLFSNIPKNTFYNFSSNSFLVQIKSKLESTEIKDLQNYVGMENNATNNYDKFDILEPPPISDELRLSILSEEKIYAQNIKGHSSEGTFWDLKISSVHQNKNINLLFEEKIKIPINFKIWLLDLEEKFSIPIINNSATINLKDQKEKYFRLIIGSEDYAKKVSDNISLLPVEYSLFQNFPNPFNPETNIYFTLVENSTVTLEIFDILGRKVKSLINSEVVNAGLQNVKWDGTNYSGIPVSSGIYIYQIKANNFIDSKKMILLK